MAPDGSSRKLFALGSLYAAQGLPFGFFSHAVPVLLNRNHPAEIVGLSSLLAVPWGFKFLFGPAVDRLPSRKKAILPLNALAVVALVVLGFAKPSADHLTPLLVGFFVVSVFSAMQDVATDALSLDLLDESERGRGSAVQVGAQRAGIIAGGGGVLGIIDYVGYREAFWLMAVGIAILTLPVLSVREPDPAARTRETREKKAENVLVTFFRRGDAWRILGFLVCFKLGDALAGGMVTRWYVKQGLSNSEIALTRGFVGGVAAIVGSLCGGVLYAAIAKRRALTIVAGLQSIAIALYVVLEALHPIGRADFARLPIGTFYAASVAEHALGGAATAALFAHMMDQSRDEARATDFTVQACLLVAVTGLGILTSGLIVRAAGLLGLFAIASLFGLLAPFAVRLLPPPLKARDA